MPAPRNPGFLTELRKWGSPSPDFNPRVPDPRVPEEPVSGWVWSVAGLTGSNSFPGTQVTRLLSWLPARAQSQEPHLGRDGAGFFSCNYVWRAHVDKAPRPLANCPGGYSRIQRKVSIPREEEKVLRAAPCLPGIWPGSPLSWTNNRCC